MIKIMKKNLLLLLLFLTSLSVYSQGKEKIRGSKIVTITQQETKEFENLEVEDNLEIFLIKGVKSAIEIEADDNLHDVIKADFSEKTLTLSTNKEISGAKKLSVRVTYTNDLKMVMAKDDANVTALSAIKLNDFTFKSFDYAKIFAYVETQTFTLMANDKSKLEINLKSTVSSTIELSKSASIKGLISTPKLTFDMYQKTSATVEGDTNDLKLRIDNDADFVGKNLITKNADLSVEGYADCSIQVSTKALISIGGNSELQLYGEPKTIELLKFSEKSTLYKKTLK